MAKVGIALGGGGARGLSHIGVIKALENNGIAIDAIAGASMGAIVGAMYAVDPNIARVEAKISILLEKAIAEMKIGSLMQGAMGKNSFLIKMRNFIKTGYLAIVSETRSSYIGIEKLRDPIWKLLPDIDIQDTKIKLAIVAIDLKGCKEVVFTKGSLRQAVLASASIPGVFPPVDINGVYHSDGGYAGSTPIRPLKRCFHPDIIIGSDVKSLGGHFERPEKAREVIDRAKYITGIILNKVYLEEAHVTISPNIKDMHWTAFAKLELLVQRGEEAASAQLTAIKLLIAKKSFTGWLRAIFTARKHSHAA